jgi:hypothetical protein
MEYYDMLDLISNILQEENESLKKRSRSSKEKYDLNKQPIPTMKTPSLESKKPLAPIKRSTKKSRYAIVDSFPKSEEIEMDQLRRDFLKSKNIPCSDRDLVNSNYIKRKNYEKEFYEFVKNQK